jgi:hypothetical protein
MKKSNRTLIGFGIAIAVLIIGTIILVLTLGKGNAALLSDKTPEGIVQRYLMAVQAKNYPAAYAYLVPQDPKNINSPIQTYDNWLTSAQNNTNTTWKANLGSVIITGDSATVIAMIDVFQPGGPFANPVHTNNITFILNKSGSNWLINSPTYLYWLY